MSLTKLFYFITLFCLWGCTSNLSDNNDINSLMNNGVMNHDNGNFKTAIEYFERVLELDKNNSYAHYEIALSCSELQEFGKTIYHSKKVIEINKELVEKSYVLYANALNEDNQQIQSITVLNEGLEKFPKSADLYYTLGINQLSIGKFFDAEKSLIKSISLNSDKPEAHLALVDINMNKKERPKALLVLYNHLLNYPNENISLEILDVLLKLQNYGTSKKGNITNTTMMIDITSESIWKNAELSVSITASKNLRNENASEFEKFKNTNNQFLSALKEIKKDSSDFYINTYVNKLVDLIDNNSSETFSYYIYQSKNDKEVTNWITMNKEKYEKLDFYIKDLQNK